MKSLLALTTLGLILGPPSLPLPHADGEDYVFLKLLERSLEGRFEIHFDDLRDKLRLEIDRSELGALEDVVASAPRVHAYIAEHFSIAPKGGTPLALEFTHQDVVLLPKRSFGQYHFRAPIDGLPDRLAVVHSMFYEHDKTHRGLLLVEYNAKTDTTYPDEYTSLVFSPTNREQTLDLTDVPAIMGPQEMIPQGFRRVWLGLGHVLFLLAILLPTVLVASDRSRPVDSFKAALWNVAVVVTVFMFAHSVALAMAAVDLVSLPTVLVQSVIAMSVVLVGLNNLTGGVRAGSLLVMMMLGLFHGLDWAAAMGDLPFRMGELMRVVIGFNIGIGLGLVGFVAVVLPVLFMLRNSPLYRPVFLKGGSVLLTLISGWWFVQQAFGVVS